MRIDVLETPTRLRPEAIGSRAVVVFDVLRATTTITAALAAGVAEIRVFDSVARATAAAERHGPGRLLVGETNCLPPPGFDLGNSPGAFTSQHAGRTVFMSTTNGTRAIVAARSAEVLFVGALVNAIAVAGALIAESRDVSLLCAGTAGEPAMEDLLGAGAVIECLAAAGGIELGNDVARIAHRLFRAFRGTLQEALADSTGGRNVIAAGLAADIAFSARLGDLDVVGRVVDHPLRIIRGGQ